MAHSLGACLLVFVVGCSRKAQSEPPRPGFVVVAGDTAGWIVPCGCVSNQSGGLPRRGAYLSELRQRGEVVLADVGGAAAGDSAYQRLKFEAILDGSMQMGLAAHNIGGPEAALGADYLRDLASRKNIPFVSANVRDSQGRPIAEPLRVVESAGRRVALSGVMSRQFANKTLCVDDPRESILALLARRDQPYDVLIVLAYLPEGELQKFAESLPEADAVVGGPTGQSIQPRAVGPTLLASATNKGKFLIQLEAPRSSGSQRWTGAVIELSEKFADDPAQLANVAEYLAELGRRDFVAGKTGLVPALPDGLPTDYGVAGTKACRECHEDDCGLWDQTRHAAAWTTLESRRSQADPYCQQCHTTAYGLPGGFVSAKRSADRSAVGCESCHGPAVAHSKSPRAKTPFAPSDQCVRCHDRENSPTFDYQEYWPRIAHGAESEVSP
jgi:hypothetical protein